MLDLSVHDPEACEGKTVDINGATYEILRPLESPYAWVTYRTRNSCTRLSLFDLRIYRDRPGSPHYAGMVREAATTPFASAAMNAAGESDVVLPPLEVYEQNGGLIGLERVDADEAVTDLRALNDRRHERLAEARDHRLRRQP